MAEQPPALSAEARAALTAYCDATSMPRAARDRVHARLSQAGPGRPAWLWIGVGALAAGLLLWGAIGVRDAVRVSDAEANGNQAPMQAPEDSGEAAAVVPAKPSEPTTRRPGMPLSSAERGPVPPVPHEATPRPAAPEPSSSPRASARRKTKSAPGPTPELEPAAPAASRLGAENRLIARTWEHVRAEQYVKARQTLAEHASEFPAGVLAPERDALFVIVACLQHPESAAGKADAYAAKGRTTLLAKVRSACDERKPTEQ